MGLTDREKKELARMVNESLDNQFAFFARPVVLKLLDSRAGGMPEWLRQKSVGEILDAYVQLRASRRIG
jgi:hypothetical protein